MSSVDLERFPLCGNRILKQKFLKFAMDVTPTLTGFLNSTLQPNLSFASNRLTTLCNSINGAVSYLKGCMPMSSTRRIMSTPLFLFQVCFSVFLQNAHRSSNSLCSVGFSNQTLFFPLLVACSAHLILRHHPNTS
jgi:hypothetical protein